MRVSDDPVALAKELQATLARVVAAGGDYWSHASLAETAIAEKDWDSAEAHLRKALDAPGVDGRADRHRHRLAAPHHPRRDQRRPQEEVGPHRRGDSHPRGRPEQDRRQGQQHHLPDRRLARPTHLPTSAPPGPRARRRSSCGHARPAAAMRSWKSWVELARGNGVSGTGTSRNAHRGAQPSATSKTSRRSGAIVRRTSSLCAR